MGSVQPITLPLMCPYARSRAILFLALAGPLCPSQTASASDHPPVQVRLSAESRPYMEAWEGFRGELGSAASMSVSGSLAPASSPRVLVAFGARASLERPADSVRLVVAMAPSILGPKERETPCIAMTPRPDELLAGLQTLQPGLRRLAVFWSSAVYGRRILPLLKQSAKSRGLEIVAFEVSRPDAVPNGLRALYGRADAIWLPPDPLLINEQTFAAFSDFSRANRIPLYVPTAGLLERGGTAWVGVGFKAMGREAARVSRELLAGREPPALNFPAPVETTVNREAAARAGLNVEAPPRGTSEPRP